MAEGKLHVEDADAVVPLGAKTAVKEDDTVANDSITIANDPPSVELLGTLFLESGFVENFDEDRLTRAIAATSRWWTVLDSGTGEAIAIGRCLTDWVRYACIYDVVVTKTRQRQGIGRALMQAIIRDLADVGTVHLWPTKGKVRFYESLGFKGLSAEQPVMVLDRS